MSDCCDSCDWGGRVGRDAVAQRRERECWSVAHEGEDDASLRPSADNPRKRRLLTGFAR